MAEKLCYGNELSLSDNHEEDLTSTILRKVIGRNKVGQSVCPTYLLSLGKTDWKIINTILKTTFAWKKLLTSFFNIPASSVSFSIEKLEKKELIEKANCEETTLFKPSLLVNGFKGIGNYQLDKIVLYKLVDANLFEEIETDLDQLFSTQELQSINTFVKRIEANKQTILVAEKNRIEPPKTKRLCYECRNKFFSENGSETLFYKGLPLTRSVWICNKCKEASQ